MSHNKVFNKGTIIYNLCYIRTLLCCINISFSIFVAQIFSVQDSRFALNKESNVFYFMRIHVTLRIIALSITICTTFFRPNFHNSISHVFSNKILLITVIVVYTIDCQFYPYQDISFYYFSFKFNNFLSQLTTYYKIIKSYF